MPSALATRDHHLSRPSRAARGAVALSSKRTMEIPSDAINAEVTVGGRIVSLTNLQKPFWPERGITKGGV